MVKPISVRDLLRGGIFLAAVGLALLPTFAAYAGTGTQGTSPAACPLGTGLDEPTIKLNLAYQGPERQYMTHSINVAETYFGQFESGTRVLIAPSLARLKGLAKGAEQAGLPYEALGYDLERWKQTPITEQGHLVWATRRAANLAHKHGKLLVMGPEFGLMEANSWAYPKMAAYADVWVIQSQRLQENPPGPTYRREVKKVINRIRAGNPNISIWVQVSVTPSGQVLSAEEVLAYREAIADLVDGVIVFDLFDPNRPKTLEAIFATVCGSGQ